MQFINLYEIFHKKKINCNITESFVLNKMFFGSGGSSNIILSVRDKDSNHHLVIKIIPEFVYFNAKIKPNQDQLEIKFYQFFTNKYLLTNRTPHIVGIYNHQICPKIDKFLHQIKPSKVVCPSYVEFLTKKINMTQAEYKICDMLTLYKEKALDPMFDVILLEYCDWQLSDLILYYMEKIKLANDKVVDMSISDLIYELDRILFQVIFTMAIIKEDYPGFMHGDFFVRNILLSEVNSHSENEYVAYHFKQKIFYLKANGLYAKINDFGLSIIVDELEPNTYRPIDKSREKFYHKNPFNQKNDIFNLLHDIYDGQNLGVISINKFITEIGADKIDPIKDFLDKFIDIKVIDKINANNHGLFDHAWYIDGIDVLENTVETPNDYLIGNYFSHYQKMPNGVVVRHYNRM